MKLKTDVELANFLEITPQNLSNCVTRNTVDWDIIFTKCVSFDFNWLLFGSSNSEQKIQNLCDTTVANNKNSAICDGKDTTKTHVSKKNTNQSIVGSTIPNKGVPLIPLEAIAGLPKDDNIGIRFVDCEHYLVPEFITQGVEYMVRVSGSSMYPKYSNGDILACKRINDILFFQWGKIYVIDSSQGVLVKRIFEDIENIDYIILSSDNKEKYPSFSFPKSDIRSLSIVVGVIRLE